MVAKVSINQSRHQAIADRIQLEWVSLLRDTSRAVVHTIRPHKISDRCNRVGLPVDSECRIRGVRPVHMKLPKPQRGTRREIGGGIDFREIVRCSRRWQGRAVNVGREVSTESRIGTVKIKINHLGRETRQHLRSLESEGARPDVIGRIKLMRAHVVGIRPQSEMRIVLKLFRHRRVEQKVVEVILPGCIRGPEIAMHL